MKIVQIELKLLSVKPVKHTIYARLNKMLTLLISYFAFGSSNNNYDTIIYTYNFTSELAKQKFKHFK